nr:serine/threonine-protein phosphatase [Oscillatoria sp. Prado101]
LFTYTDGVPEAHNPACELFTDERLLAVLESPPPSAKGLLDLIETQVRQHIADADQFDDITMLAVRRLPKD